MEGTSEFVLVNLVVFVFVDVPNKILVNKKRKEKKRKEKKRKERTKENIFLFHSIFIEE